MLDTIASPQTVPTVPDSLPAPADPQPERMSPATAREILAEQRTRGKARATVAPRAWTMGGDVD